MAKTKALICPYCGHPQTAGEACAACGGTFTPLSRQATHNAMGPWHIRDTERPFHPGIAYERLVQEIDKGRVTKTSIIRGPTTRQFWCVARRVAGIAHLLGYCHECDGHVVPTDTRCSTCGAAFGAYLDRNHLGLPDVAPLPDEAGYDGRSTGYTSRHDLVPSTAPGSISSFGSNEEISANGTRTAATRTTPAPRAAASPPPHPQPKAESESAAKAAATIRAMEWRLHRQQTMIRWLTTMVVVFILATIVTTMLSLGVFSGGDDDGTADGTRPSTPASTADPVAPRGVPVGGGNDDGDDGDDSDDSDDSE